MKKILLSLAAFLMLGSLSLSVCGQDSGKFLADRHVARGLNCASCHGTKPPAAQLPEDKERHEPCVACHGFYDKVAKKTQPKNPEEMNPHSQHDGNLPCTTCHQGHKPGKNYCAQCHYYTFKVP